MEVLQLIALPEVVKTSGISKSEIFRRVKNGTFPAPTKLGTGRCTRWAAHEIQAWVRSRLDERGKGASQ